MYISLDDWPTWTAEFRPWVERRFSPEVFAAFTKDAEPDWLTWLDHEQAAVDGRLQDTVTLFEEAIRATYLGIRVIHASRLPSIDPVVQHGLRAWSAADLRLQAHDLFRDAPHVRLQQEIEACAPDHRGGYVYSFASVHHALCEPDEYRGGRLPDFCVHGGEFLAAVRHGLGHEAIPPPGETRAFYFACNLPWALLEDADVTSLAKTMLLNVLTSNYVESDFSFNMYGEYSCITTGDDIRPEHIALFADVEHLVGRDDLVPDDIPWELFRR